MSDAERWRRIRQLFERCVDMTREDRATFLERECRHEVELIAEVERLIKADQQAALGGLTSAVESALEAAAETDVVGKMIGPYRVMSVLGRGGMGVVLAAERVDGSYRKQVAIKVLQGVIHSEEMQRSFLHERQVLATLEHPGIARLLEGGTTEEGVAYLVMERVDGVAIHEYCRQQALGLKARLQLMIKVCRAVSHAHSRLVVHRDLKPLNVLVDNQGETKLLDFGIAKLLDPDGTTAGQTVDWLLTPEFASPEQIEGGPITVATDVYGLGGLLYQLLVGRSPFADVASIPTELIRAITTTQATPPSLAAARGRAAELPTGKLSRELDAVVLRALRKEPHRRYPSVEQLLADLVNVLEARPVSALPDSVGYRVKKFVQRQWVPTLAAVVAALSLVGGLLAREAEARRAQREGDVAVQVSVFLESLFTAATPQEARGQEITANDLLDRGATRIQEQLHDQPVVRIRLLQTIANSYRLLGNYEQAKALYQQALELQEEHAHEDRVAIADTLLSLGTVEAHAGSFAEAEPYARQSLAIYRQELPAQHEKATFALDFLGKSLSLQAGVPGKLEEAEEALNAARVFYDNSPGRFAEQSVANLRQLAAFYWDQGRPARMIDTSERAAALARSVFGEEAPITLSIESMWAFVRLEVGDYEGAKDLFARSCPAIERVFGPRHDEHSGCLSREGHLWLELGNLDAAEDLLLRALDLERELYGEGHHYTAYVELQVARLLLQQGALNEASRQATRAVEAQERGFGEQHHIVADARHALAEIRIAEGRRDEAQRLLRLALPVRRSTYGAGSLRHRQTEELLQLLQGD